VALFVAGVFAAMGVGISSALAIYINTYFWELSSGQMSLLTLPLFLSALLAVGLAPPLSIRMGKKQAAIAVSMAALVVSPAPIALRLLGLFPPNGTPLLLPAVVLFNIVSVTLFITSSILTASMVADLAEDSEVATGRRSEGVFVAANMFVQKAVSGIGIFGSSLLLGVVGFPRDAKPGAIDPAIVWRLGFVYVTLLVAVYAIAIACLASYRISRERHEENLRRLATGDPG
jgi:Na+/melibiose symporter-like transporter